MAMAEWGGYSLQFLLHHDGVLRQPLLYLSLYFKTVEPVGVLSAPRLRPYDR